MRFRQGTIARGDFLLFRLTPEAGFNFPAGGEQKSESDAPSALWTGRRVNLK
jgi:hypothetical protein